MSIQNENTYGLEKCLIVPVAAKSIQAIERFAGKIIQKSRDDKWCYVEFTPLSPPDELEVWNHPNAQLITASRQCWVRIDYTAYRNRYKKCFPQTDLTNRVIDHVLNRRFARPLGFNYVRLIHIGRGVNSSSGRGQEYDVIHYHNPDGLSRFNASPDEIYYADPADLLKLLNVKVGAFPLENVRDKLHWFYRSG